MSDEIHEECGIALIRLLKPLDFYREKYGTPYYGLNKLYLLMEKQHNRGQDGAGIVTVKLDVPPGKPVMNRLRSVASNAIEDIFTKIHQHIAEIQKTKGERSKNSEWLKMQIPFLGELLLGHLRYGTFGKNRLENCHPFKRQNNWLTKTLAMAGNFNLTNVDELFKLLVELGQHPSEKADTVTLLEKIAHFLDKENERLFKMYKAKGHSNHQISDLIASNLDLKSVLHNSCKHLDGGFVLAGVLGHGDAFVVRDPNGIRPAFYYCDDEIAVAASERPALQTTFNIQLDNIKELQPGKALIIKKNGACSEEEILPAGEKKACSFERIYFSRGNDRDIYLERKTLGKLLVQPVLKEINGDLENTVFSYIPNTAEVAFAGMYQEIERWLDEVKEKEIQKLITGGNGKSSSPGTLKKLLSLHPRIEKIALKDTKLRTFITNDVNRDDKTAHVYDTTYGIIRPGKDVLVILDDSIVRGTTLKQSILKILDRLSPKKIIVVSSAPQIRYPDCYGIDMAKLGDLIAFQAAIALLKESFKDNLLDDIYRKAKVQDKRPKEEITNLVKEIYAGFTPEQISGKIGELLKPQGIRAEVEIIFQNMEGLHQACPNHNGDWYFTGNYPTPGGNKVCNRSFINYMEGKNVRAYS